MNQRRKSGILLHPTSLPGPGGIGSFGREALRFIDFLERAGQTLWQVLPLCPVGYGNSPYSSYSAFAGEPLCINLERIADEDDLLHSELNDNLPEDMVDYDSVRAFKLSLLGKAATTFFEREQGEQQNEFWRFCDTTFWLHDYALFMALKEHFRGKSWNKWPAAIAAREPAAIAEWTEKLGPAIGEQKYLQWQFFRQWHDVRQYANNHGIAIIGDLPIFVAYDSADVWTNPQLFLLDDKRMPTVVAGVPPDYFSKTGQRWGNPLYNWERMAADGFAWWIGRMGNALALHDIVRIDHFRGFEAYWEVPVAEKTAIMGRWIKGPGGCLFNALRNALGPLPIIAEDLGVITPEVEALRDTCAFPGMKILQFAFDSGPGNPYLPHNHIRESVTYTGTHDNDTTVGWFASLPEKTRERVLSYLHVSARDWPWDLIRTALASVANTAIIPLQDVLSLGSSARMNTPGTASGNWSWRFSAGSLSDRLAGKLHDLTRMYGR